MSDLRDLVALLSIGALFTLSACGDGDDDANTVPQGADTTPQGTRTNDSRSQAEDDQLPAPRFVNANNVEVLLRANLKNREPPKAVQSVVCPERVETQEGGTFECTVRFRDGGQEQLRARQVNSSGRVTFAGGGG